jgi:hypothetical protein
MPEHSTLKVAMLVASLAAPLSLYSSNATTASIRKPAWEWTDEERIAGRIDDASAASRVRADHSRTSASFEAATHAVSERELPYDVVLGDRNPELFLSFDVFDLLIRLAFADDSLTRSAYREGKEIQRESLGLPADMWDRLAVMAAAYRDDRKLEREIALSDMSESTRTTEARFNSRAICRDRFAALSEARAEFGPAFDRFLYSAVAPEMFEVVARRPDANVLRSTSRGCRD